MKIKLNRVFRYQETPTKVVEHGPGVVDLPERYALAAIRQRAGVRVEKEEKPDPKPNPKSGAPENKASKGADDKKGVGKTSKRSSGTRAKS